MARPARPWFRFYVEAMRDPKMRRLTPAQRWLWVAALAAARESVVAGLLLVAEGVPMECADLADYAGMKVRETDAGLLLFLKLGMIAVDGPTGAWHIVNWSDRQYESDDVTARTAKHRARERDGNVPTSSPGTFENPTETETETETEVNTPIPPQAGAVDKSTQRPSRAAGTSPRQLAAAAEANSDLIEAGRLGRDHALDSTPRFQFLALATRKWPNHPAAVAEAERAYDAACARVPA
jgi:hypothetical protein